MLEVLGAAASVAQLLDLGVSICHNLLNYYQSRKEAEKDVKTTCASIENLAKSFSILAELLNRNCYAEDVQSQVERTVAMCEGGLGCLQRKLHKIKVATESQDRGGRQAEFRRQLHLALYPFRESTLIKLKEVCIAMQSNLIISLQLLQTDVSSVSVQTLREVSSKTDNLSLAITNMQGNVESSNISLKAMNKYNEDQNFTAMHSWLSPLFEDFNSKQQTMFNTTARQDRLATRILQMNDIQRWLHEPGIVVWCVGARGVGKTILASFLINFIQQKTENLSAGVAYIYCDYNESKKHSAQNFLGVILQQLCIQKSGIISSLATSYESHRRNKTAPSLETLGKLLQVLAESISRLYLIMDGVDECPSETRDLLFREIRKLHPKISLFMTSRHVASAMLAFPTKIICEVTADERDIECYLSDRLKGSDLFQSHMLKNQTLREQIISSIVTKAKGMFLLARLQLESLLAKTTIRKVKSALQSLPEELDAMYDQVMERIKNQDPETSMLALRALSWIHHAVRPLNAAELCHALAVEPGDKVFDDEGVPESALVTAVCAGLVTLQGSGTFALVHYTAEEYLKRRPRSLFPDIKLELAQNCLTYVSLDDFGEGPSLGDEQLDKRLTLYPFYSYAASFWGCHVRGDAEAQLQSTIVEFISQEMKTMSSIQALQTTKSRYPKWSQEFTKLVTGLWVAINFELPIVCAFLMSQGADLEAKDSSGQRLLHRAAIQGCTDIMDMLLERQVDLDATSNDYKRTALHWASVHGHYKIAKALLARHAQVDARDKGKRTVLSLAASNGDESLVRLLLDAGADIDARDAYGGTPLYRAAESGNHAATRILLDAGANINAASIFNQTALHRAADVGHLAVTVCLLEKGANVNLKDEYGWTPFYRASDNGHGEVATLLLEHVQQPKELAKPLISLEVG